MLQLKLSEVIDNDINRDMRNTVEHMVEEAVRDSEQDSIKQEALCTTEQLLQEAVNVATSADRWCASAINSMVHFYYSYFMQFECVYKCIFDLQMGTI